MKEIAQVLQVFVKKSSISHCVNIEWDTSNSEFSVESEGEEEHHDTKTDRQNQRKWHQSNQRPDPEVLPKAKRRTFTAAYKLWVLEEADKCREQPGQIGALLRREGLYSSHLTTWRRQREAGQMAGLKPRKRGRKRDEEAAEMNQLRRENKRLTRQLEQAELIIEAQKKLSEILGITLEQPKDGGNESNRDPIGAENKHETGV